MDLKFIEGRFKSPSIKNDYERRTEIFIQF